ncbi:uncharacterized protein LOC102380745 [Alligator sinensis]|uniref:Uncharacterized protein LOC102380745 n=1 Tax=Alligator sinensis TaxID=38654 RepID=A0A3Q0GW47_ALLSI|nr:uncharacterized protein LOC102380745 [Alligator sinensis]XP_025062400.1 uncharacterized protein LOC102380745 [Alligator sinensis]
MLYTYVPAQTAWVELAWLLPDLTACQGLGVGEGVQEEEGWGPSQASVVLCFTPFPCTPSPSTQPGQCRAMFLRAILGHMSAAGMVPAQPDHVLRICGEGSRPGPVSHLGSARSVPCCVPTCCFGPCQCSFCGSSLTWLGCVPGTQGWAGAAPAAPTWHSPKQCVGTQYGTGAWPPTRHQPGRDWITCSSWPSSPAPAPPPTGRSLPEFRLTGHTAVCRQPHQAEAWSGAQRPACLVAYTWGWRAGQGGCCRSWLAWGREQGKRRQETGAAGQIQLSFRRAARGPVKPFGGPHSACGLYFAYPWPTRTSREGGLRDV